MSAIVNYSPELSAWIRHNLDRGCGVDDLVSSMVENKFEPTVARNLVEAFWRAHHEGLEPLESIEIETALDDYRYETPRLPAGTVIRTSDHEDPVLLRLEQPVTALLGNVLSDEECDQLIEMARPRLQPSTVVDLETGEKRLAEHRDNEGMFFKLNENPFIARLDRRISELMNCPIENGEGMQILRYGPKAKNTPHFGFLVPSNARNSESLPRSGQRISTLVIYLNDVKAGGETVFPEVGGLAISPKKGNGAYFEYSNSLCQMDPRSVHASAPVIEGEKWALPNGCRKGSSRRPDETAGVMCCRVFLSPGGSMGPRRRRRDGTAVPAAFSDCP